MAAADAERPPGAGARRLDAARRRRHRRHLRFPHQDAAQVGPAWPSGPVDARMAPYMLQAQQKWSITPVDKPVAIQGRRISRSPWRAPTARSLRPPMPSSSVVPAFSGGPDQLWRIDQLTDGTYRLMPKAVPNSKEPLALSAVGSSMPTLEKFNAGSDRQRWLLKTP